MTNDADVTTDAHDPLSPLTPAEVEMIEILEQRTREELLAELKDNLQTAVLIELATIPIYLYTYYSIQRAEASGENVRPADLFANKAGGVIMSVAVEEMLHMSLSSNILFSLGVDPQLYQQSPGSFPTPLPYHNPVGPPGPHGAEDALVKIPLAKFTYEQLWHFLQIEYPAAIDAWPEDRNWDTIGQFYSYIRCLILCSKIYDTDFQVRGKDSIGNQIQPFNYSTNNVDTVHPRRPFNPWALPPTQRGGGTPADVPFPSAADVAVFSNEDDSHAGQDELITIDSKISALTAIATICDQGEGFQHRATDDPSRTEDSHYFKFLKLQAQLPQYTNHVETLPALPKPPAPITPTVTDVELDDVIINFPDNPTTASYVSVHSEHPASVDPKPISDLVNGVYQYMLILTETTYRVPADQQRLFFNQAMHMTMIWVLDKIIQIMRKLKLGDGHYLAPTFENIDLGTRDNAYANLMKLAAATEGLPYYGDLEYYIGLIKGVPDVSKYWAPGEPTPAPYPYADAPTWPQQIGKLPLGSVLHACMGLNSCKGQDRFGLAGPPDGPRAHQPNECAGQGYCSTAVDHTCHVKNECKNQGGCGLYGTNEEQDNAGWNDCKSLGSCATPINAERFSTDGKNRGKSVWARARAVFEDHWSEIRQHVEGAPETLGPAPAPFTETGPPYLWISNDNKDRGNMTACGASGMSGAGGCV